MGTTDVIASVDAMLCILQRLRKILCSGVCPEDSKLIIFHNFSDFWNSFIIGKGVYCRVSAADVNRVSVDISLFSQHSVYLSHKAHDVLHVVCALFNVY